MPKNPLPISNESNHYENSEPQSDSVVQENNENEGEISKQEEFEDYAGIKFD